MWPNLFSLTLLMLLGPAGSVAGEPDAGGSIQGTVRITEKLTEQRMRFRLYPGANPSPPAVAQGQRSDEFRNIVIYLKSAGPPGPTGSTEPREFHMSQEGETFIPHVLPVPVGSTVQFPNHDPIFHNVFSLSATSTFDLGRYPQGDSKSVRFDKPGLVPVFCHIHSDMSAIILVLENPHFTVPGADGRYRIDNIPPGTYSLVAWHERSEPVEKQVEVKAGQPLEVDFTVPIENEDASRP